jgi:cytochrome c peroxidase
VFRSRQIETIEREIRVTDLAAFRPLPDDFFRDGVRAPAARIQLGRQLFFDQRFSKSQALSCNSCHPLAKYGMDGVEKSIGHLGRLTRRNAPSVYNAAGQVSQFWDGRAADVEEQAKVPLLNPDELAMDEAKLLEILRAIPGYVEAFASAFSGDSEPLSFDNFARAIASFERDLLTPSRWDAFLKGDATALSDQEKKGFVTFTEVGCPNCHAGALIGGNHFESLGQAKPWPNQSDRGSAELGSSASAPPTFKVASLRNVEKTAPYFHDGSSGDLRDAVRRMALHQLGIELRAAQTAAIVTWLGTLTGQLPPEYIEPPKLPPSDGSSPAR